MKHYFAVLTVLAGLLAAPVLLAQHNHGTAPSASHSMTGVISDTMCGKTHMLPGKTDAECIRECIKAGSKYALVAGDKVWTLSGDSKKIEPFAGRKVKVTGEMKGNTMTVDSIAEAK